MIRLLKKRRNKDSQNTFGDLKNDSFDFEQIKKYFGKKDHSNSFQLLSDKTCNDLDFEELFMFVDRTESRIGQQFLYGKLRSIPYRKEDNSKNEWLIQKLSEDLDFRLFVRKQLKKLNNQDAYYITSIFQEDHVKPPKWFFVTRLLSFANILSLLLLFVTVDMVFVIGIVFIINLIIHYWNKRNLYQYLNSIPQLLRLNKIAKELFNNNRLKDINPDLLKSISILEKVKRRMSFFNIEAKFQGDFEAVFWGIMELFKILFLIEPIILFGVLKQLDSKRKQIETIFQFVGYIDSSLSIASLRKGTGSFCLPTIIETKKTINALEVYHPLIPECIKNSIEVKKKSILLTGSNMSGKTSFIRTIAINAITGQTLNTCFADQFSMPRMSISSAIRISDDLLNDKSYYFEEVLTIKEMIDKSNNEIPNLFLLDEIFKGTNTIERISAGKAVLSALTKNENIVFVSTHDIELADLLKDEFDLFHFSEKVDHKTVDFDYKLKEGKLKNRNAIRILQINDYPEKIINEAIEISKKLDEITVGNILQIP
ncbi:MAG: hypothetical protein PF486_02760 [Prolixibacteraceae bacterium]|jgi:hypothetical protein|nr:hypothetical protein [Prolixibacteraceae bacterium]